MKIKSVVFFLALALGATVAGASPVAYNEVSLLVRMRESNAYIVQQVRSRSLLRPLSPQQESTLVAQGAPEQLLAALRDPKVILSEVDAAAYEARAERERVAILQSVARDEADARQRARDLARAAAESPGPPQYQEAPSSQADLLPSNYDNDGDLFSAQGSGRSRRDGNFNRRSSGRTNTPSVAFHGRGFSSGSPLNGPGSFSSSHPVAISSNAVFSPGHR
jgi:hypothetical protein